MYQQYFQDSPTSGEYAANTPELRMLAARTGGVEALCL
jgi:hypothetical protein